MEVRKHLIFNGTPESVERIMDVVGTQGVNNGRERLYIRGDYLNRGDCVTVEDGHWWIDHHRKGVVPVKFPVAE